MRRLARDILTRNPNLPGDDRFRVEIAARRYAGAARTLAGVRRPNDLSPRIRAIDIQYAIYIAAQRIRRPFDKAYPQAFRAMLGKLDDRTAAVAINRYGLEGGPPALVADLQRLNNRKNTALADVVTLVRDYVDAEIFRATDPLDAALIAEDDARRYIVDKDVAVPTPDGAVVCTLVARPRKATARLPALLQFTIYNDAGSLMREARRTASNGYIGVMGLTRGKGCSSGPIVPYEHDGADAGALIDWIAKRPWSDGQVGMYGGSYSGFTPWAAAKRRPKALKAIMVGAPGAPGIDSPMEGNVVWSFLYPWPFYTADNKTLDNATYGDNARWNKLNHDWYVSGRAYRDLDKIDGRPNPVFDRWLEHESYDAYWQGLIPYRDEFASIDIPVLETAGYYFGGPGAAWYYFGQHRKYDPKAEHYLILGPYDHFLAQRGTLGIDGDPVDLAGYALDRSALIDLVELRYRWFDYALKGAAKPAILADKVNYEVPGADAWKHAPSLAGMAARMQRFYLSAARDGATLKFADTTSSGTIPLRIDFKDRGDVDRQAPGGNVLDKDLDTSNGIEFESAPFARQTELSGLFSGHLEFTANKKDFDFQIVLYAQMPDGRYMQLVPYWTRASYAGDLTRRRLLEPGVPQTLDFTAARPMSLLCPRGSRLVMVLSGIKDPGRQINLGTGKPVNDETLADAGAPLAIDWSAASFIDAPLGR